MSVLPPDNHAVARPNCQSVLSTLLGQFEHKMRLFQHENARPTLQPVRKFGLERLFRPLIVAEEQRMITCRGRLLVQPHHTIADHPPLDVIVIPGGQGTRRERLNGTVLDWIVAQHQHTEVTTSVCTGAFLLAERGLSDGLRATTHWASIAWMREHYPSARMVDDERFVDEGHIVTSAGVSAGIDMALHVVARLDGEATAAATARSMEYDRTSAALSPG